MGISTKEETEKDIATESISEKESVADGGKSPDRKGDDRTSEDDRMLLDSERRKEEERRLVRKLDMRLLPMIILIYIMNYIDVKCISGVLSAITHPSFILRCTIENGSYDC